MPKDKSFFPGQITEGSHLGQARVYMLVCVRAGPCWRKRLASSEVKNERVH